MQTITPISTGIPNVLPDHSTLAGKVARVEGGDRLWVLGRVSSGSVDLIPYFFVAAPEAPGLLKGAWLPVCGDADATQKLALDVAVHSGAGHGRFEWSSESRNVVLVEASAMAPVYELVQIGSVSTAGA